MTYVPPTKLWFERFETAIGVSGVRPPDDFTDRFSTMAAQQPLYVENVRALLDIQTTKAKAICDSAVAAGLLTHRTGLLCPNETCGRMLLQTLDGAKLPRFITCEVCEGLEQEKFEFPTSDCPEMDCYYIETSYAELDHE